VGLAEAMEVNMNKLPYDEDDEAYFESLAEKMSMNNKEENCECGLTEDNTWSDETFDRYGCDCENDDE
jgi:hypothetical protein